MRPNASLLLSLTCLAGTASPAWPQALIRVAKPRMIVKSEVVAKSTAAHYTIFADTKTKAEVSRSARGMLVGVGLAFKPMDPESALDPDYYYSFGDSWSVKSKVQQAQRLWTAGVRVDAEGSVVAKATEYNWDAIESVETFAADGSTAAARVSGISRRGRLLWLKAPGLPALAFPKLSTQTVRVDGWYFCASADDFENEPTFRVNECSPHEKTWFATRRTARRLESYSMSGAVFDTTGAWIGTDPEHDQLDSSGTWRASLADLREDFLSREAYEEAKTRAGRSLLDRLVPVRLRFQKKGADPGSALLASFFSDEGGDLKERVDEALPVRPGLLLVPHPLDRKLVGRLESITALAGGRELPARFVGTLREFSGYLVAVEGGLGAASLEPAALPDDDLLAIAVVPRYRGGALDFAAHHEYLSGVLRGYKDTLWRRPLYSRRRGTVLCALDGAPFAVLLEQRRYDKEPEKNRFDEPQATLVPFPLSELAQYLKDPAAQVDPLVAPPVARGGRAQKRKPWLGVETQNIGRDWAELRGAQRETRDGTIGQLVTLVYPGSPAERAGVKAGDLLLKVQEAGKKDEVLIPSDLSPSASYSMDYGARATILRWFKRKRPIAEFIDRFNAGARVRLTYARAQKERSAELVLEEAPEDLESSPKLRHERTGLVLKPLPYDVRQLLRLGADASGLIVAEVESGSPAQVAGVQPLDLVMDAAGKRTASFEEFSKAADEARGELKLRTRFLHVTRVVTLKL